MQFYWSNFISTEYTFSLLDFTFTKYCCFLPLRFFNKGKGCCWLRFFLFVLPNHGKVSDNCYYWKPHVGFLRFGKWNQTVNINVDNSFTRKVFILLMDTCMKTKKKLYINTILHYFVFFYHFTSIFKTFFMSYIFVFEYS